MIITLELDDTVADLLAVLGAADREGQARLDKVTFAIEALIDHAQQGVYRPGAWERDWLTSVFGDAWTTQLEPGDPYGRPNCERIFTRPKGTPV